VTDVGDQQHPVSVLSAKIDVVIPTYDAPEQVLACVARLRQCEEVGRITVVDDASTDELADRFETDGEVQVIRLAEHRGLAYAFNRGTAVGRSEFVLFLNDDVLVGRTALARLLEAMLADRDSVSAGGRLVEPGTAITQIAYQPRQIPGLAGLLVRLLGVERVWPRNPWTGRHLTEPLPDETRRRTDRQPAGACLIVRRSALEQVGGWNERYWMWYEDVDLSRRLAAIGPALYVPDAVFEHTGAASTRTWRKHEQHLRLYHGTLIYAEAHLSRWEQVSVATTMAAVCLLRLGFHKARGDEAARSYRRLLRSSLALARFRQVPPAPFALARQRSSG
jgi:N-acetylglucosaminyl-diphospho-decaprenol L-rhamnosyltransferase